MVFEVIGKATALSEPSLAEPTLTEPMLTEPTLTEPTLTEPTLTEPTLSRTPGEPAVAGTPDDPTVVTTVPEPRTPRRTLPPGVISQLLRSAVSLQAEGVLRTAGALAGAWGGVLDRTAWIERDARDLSLLAAAAVAADVPLPAGVDTGAGDPGHPGSVVESLLAGNEALVHVLRQLADVCDDGGHGWGATVQGILSRREEEILLLRAVGASGRLPVEEQYMRGRPPRV
jgi:hypothetical protein